MSEERELEAALAANAAFYQALAQGDYPAMEALWSASEPLICSHPGTPSAPGPPGGDGELAGNSHPSARHRDP